MLIVPLKPNFFDLALSQHIPKTYRIKVHFIKKINILSQKDENKL